MAKEKLILEIRDVMVIFNRGERTARKRIKQANERVGLPDEPFISLEAFCEAFKFNPKRVLALINGDSDNTLSV